MTKAAIFLISILLISSCTKSRSKKNVDTVQPIQTETAPVVENTPKKTVKIEQPQPEVPTEKNDTAEDESPTDTTSDDPTAEEAEAKVFFDQVVKFFSELVGQDGTFIFTQESALEMAQTFIGLDIDLESFQSVNGFFGGLVNSDSSFVFAGADSVVKTLEFLSAGGNIADLTASFNFFSQLNGSQSDSPLYMNATALELSEKFLATGLNLTDFQSILQYFGNMVGQDTEQKIFSNSEAVDFTFAAMSDKNFDLTSFMAKYMIFQSMTAQDETLLFDGKQAAQKALDVLGVQFILSELLNKTKS